jgi:kumamolisin
MWAAFIALANQQAAADSKAAVGFFNPSVYAQNESGGALTATYTTDFHDITSGKSGTYSAVTGYDLVTGWGSPKAALINTLVP